ncbi:MAG: type IV pilus assembly protein PilM [FCB group bacterium]|nr:type IV pilus assembly protein PilM [FCB group bacterium]
MIVGLDIGRQVVKAVVVEKTKTGFKLLNIGERLVPEPNKAFDPDSITAPSWVIAVREVLRDLKLNPKRVKKLVTGLNGSKVSIKQITTMEMASDELISAMTFEARKHIPMDGSEAVIDFQILGPNKKEVDKIDISLVACTQKVINSHLDLLKDAGLKPGIVDTDPVAVSNTYINKHDLPEEGVVVLVDIGSLSTSLIVRGRTDELFIRDIPIGGHHFVKWLSKTLSQDYPVAEETLAKYGVSAHLAEKAETNSSAIAVADRTIFDNLVEDLRRSLRYYAKTTGQSFFQKIFLSGGGALTPGLAEFVQEKLNVETTILDPLAILDGVEKYEIPNRTQYTVAVGLAIRGGIEE